MDEFALKLSALVLASAAAGYMVASAVVLFRIRWDDRALARAVGRPDLCAGPPYCAVVFSMVAAAAVAVVPFVAARVLDAHRAAVGGARPAGETK